jgi:hypothetical protein
MWDSPVILTEVGRDMKRKRHAEKQTISILKLREVRRLDA